MLHITTTFGLFPSAALRNEYREETARCGFYNPGLALPGIHHQRHAGEVEAICFHFKKISFGAWLGHSMAT